MPTERKVQSVEQLRKLIERCTVAISADHSGMSVSAMTDLRRSLRDRGVVFHVIKNRLAYLAADAAGKPALKEIVHGPTGLALGFADPVEPAKALTQFLRSGRYTMAIKAGVLGERVLTAAEVGSLAALPGKDELISQLLRQFQGPVTGLARVLDAPISALARVLQRRVETASEDAESGAEPVAVELPDDEPAAAEPADEKPAEVEPADTEPAGEEPTDAEPAGEEPSAGEPAETEPADTEPSPAEPAEEESADEGPAPAESAEQEPAAAEPEPSPEEEAALETDAGSETAGT